MPYLQTYKDELINFLMNGTYTSQSDLRVEILKENGKKRQFGIPVVIDRVI